MFKDPFLIAPPPFPDCLALTPDSPTESDKIREYQYKEKRMDIHQFVALAFQLDAKKRGLEKDLSNRGAIVIDGRETDPVDAMVAGAGREAEVSNLRLKGLLLGQVIAALARMDAGQALPF